MPTEFLYHATSPTRIRLIRESGMRIDMVGSGATAIGNTNSGRELQGDHDYTMLHFGSLAWAEDYFNGLGDAAVIRVRSENLNAEQLQFVGNEWRYPNNIPPENIEILLRDGATWQRLTETAVLASEGGPDYWSYLDDSDESDMSDSDEPDEHKEAPPGEGDAPGPDGSAGDEPPPGEAGRVEGE